MRDVRLSFRDCSGSRSTVDRDRSRSRAGGRSAAVEKTKNKRGLEDNSSSQSWESASCTDSTIDLTSDATTPDNRRQRRRKKLKKKSSGSGSVSGSGYTTEKEVKASEKTASSTELRRSPSPVDVMETDSAPPPPSDVAPGRQPSPPPQPFTPPSEKEELMREMMLRIGGLINARFEGLEGRLLPAPNLRPPLAADKKKAAAKAAKEAPAETAPKPVPGKGKKAGQKAAPMPTQAKEVPPPKGKNGVAKSPDAAEATASTSTPQTAEAWNVVVSRKAKAKKAKAAAQAAEAAADASKKAKASKKRPRKKRSLKAPRNPAVYWWSGPLADQRKACNRAKRLLGRYKKRRTRDPAVEGRLLDAYKVAKRALQMAIRTAKSEAWTEMLEGVDSDIWGRPYRMVRNKLRAVAAPLTESLQPELLDRVVSALFPPDLEGFVPPLMVPEDLSAASLVPSITDGEFEAAVRRLKGTKKAPGPDGVPGRALAVAIEPLERH
ncbi:hypothetical protein ACJJTC_000388, partial [Scirpophaga incertulas]